MMFSPESGQLDQFNNKLEFTPTIGSNNFSEKGDELINISNDNSSALLFKVISYLDKILLILSKSYSLKLFLRFFLFNLNESFTVAYTLFLHYNYDAKATII